MKADSTEQVACTGLWVLHLDGALVEGKNHQCGVLDHAVVNRYVALQRANCPYLEVKRMRRKTISIKSIDDFLSWLLLQIALDNFHIASGVVGICKILQWVA